MGLGRSQMELKERIGVADAKFLRELTPQDPGARAMWLARGAAVDAAIRKLENQRTVPT